jgi:hypothetical protein
LLAGRTKRPLIGQEDGAAGLRAGQKPGLAYRLGGDWLLPVTHGSGEKDAYT